MNGKTPLLLLALLLLSTICVNAQKLRAEFSMARFDSPADGPYLETYLKLKGSSLQLVEDKAESYSEVLIKCAITGTEGIAYQDHYIVQGPRMKNDSVKSDFIDQHRISLKPGKYVLEVSVKDVNDTSGRAILINQEILMEGVSSEATISDIQLVDEYYETEKQNVLSKVGFDLVPFTSNYFGEDRNELTYYVESYYRKGKFYWGAMVVAAVFNPAIALPVVLKLSVDQHVDVERFVFDVYIENADNANIVRGLRKFFRHKGQAVVPTLHSFPLDQVPSGNYNLVMEVKDNKNQVLARKVLFFQRNNGASNKDAVLDERRVNETYGTFVDRFKSEELTEYLRCLHPISTPKEIYHVNRTIEKNFFDQDMMKHFMYNYWIQRNPENPEKAWQTYWKKVESVNAEYTTNLKKGYDTDRGRVYLQYGAPNTIAPFYFEAETFPHEIWHYYRLEDHLNAPQSNRKFIFANTSRGSAEYDLLHSDADNEMNNPNWNFELNRRPNAVIDQENGNDGFGSKSREFFDNPY